MRCDVRWWPLYMYWSGLHRKSLKWNLQNLMKTPLQLGGAAFAA